jgi:hypothetical protein
LPLVAKAAAQLKAVDKIIAATDGTAFTDW